MNEIQVKRVYDAPGSADGVRVLVDRLWPRGLSKERARVDHWLRELAPSTELRKWYGHDPDKWREFRERYLRELRAANSDDLDRLREQIHSGERVTLLFGSKEREKNNAVALRQFIDEGEI